jgi:16S rRNA (uracil1498-N3)-methyltransferase
VTVVLGHPRPPVLKRLWRDLASLGVREIRVFHGELGERSYGTSSAWENPGRWLTEGVSQGAHTMMPELSRYGSLREALTRDTSAPEPSERRFFGNLERSGAMNPREIGHGASPAAFARVCIGPERGLTSGEHVLLQEFGYQPVYLGPRTLRTETATVILTGIAAVEVESSRW